jgi:hypothetical protein
MDGTGVIVQNPDGPASPEDGVPGLPRIPSDPVMASLPSGPPGRNRFAATRPGVGRTARGGLCMK